MAKKLTILIDDAVYEGLHRVVGHAGWEARLRCAGAGCVRENLWGGLPPDESPDR